MQLSFTFTHISIQANGNTFQKVPKNKLNYEPKDCLGTPKYTWFAHQSGAVLHPVGENLLALHGRNAEDSSSQTAVSLTGHNGWPSSIWVQQQHDVYITSSQWVLSIPPSPWWPAATAHQGLHFFFFFPPLFGCKHAYPDKIVCSCKCLNAIRPIDRRINLLRNL